MDDPVNISVTVPREYVPDVYAFVAQLLVGGRPVGSPGAFHDARAVQLTSMAMPGPPGRYTDYHAMYGFKPDIVKANYRGGVSDYWRPFLDALAKTPDEWVAWESLCDAISLPRTRASGMLGAAERRCKGYPPYEKYEGTDGFWFRMPSRVAEYVREAAQDTIV